MNKIKTGAAQSLLVMLAVSGGMLGCTTVETQSFRVNKDASVESAQIATGADFSKYRRLLAEDMGIFFPNNARSTAEDMQRIRQIFRGAFLSELSAYEIVREPAAGTMAVQASLIDLRNSTSEQIPGMRREVREMATPGSLVFLMELKDSQSGKVLARAADSASAPAIATADGLATDWPGVERAAERWARLFRQFLDDNLGR